MRKGQRFTPTKIANWETQGRGAGVFAEYRPWHQVTRGDPASKGRSHIMQWASSQRSHHFLSDGEADVFAFITMLPNIVDVREQVPLALDWQGPQIAAYSMSHPSQLVPGTLACAELMRVKHPQLRADGSVHPWVMSTDFVVTLRRSPSEYELVAVSVKPQGGLDKNRTRNLLRLERMFWEQQKVQWLLITPSEYQKAVSNTIRRAMPWGVPKVPSDRIPIERLNECTKLCSEFNGTSLTDTLVLIQNRLAIPMESAQRTFWQAVWAGQIPLSLLRSSWPSEPIRLLEPAAFLAQNPIAVRRSACL